MRDRAPARHRRSHAASSAAARAACEFFRAAFDGVELPLASVGGPASHSVRRGKSGRRALIDAGLIENERSERGFNGGDPDVRP
jgi:hypothetical protein